MEERRKTLSVLSLGVQVDLDEDRTAEIREHEDASEGWEETLQAVAAGDEVFVVARFFAVYAGHEEPSYGSSHLWHTLSTRRDVVDDLVQIATDVYENDWTTEFGEMRMAGWEVDRADYERPEATLRIGRTLAQRLSIAARTSHGAQPTWRFAVEGR